MKPVCGKMLMTIFERSGFHASDMVGSVSHRQLNSAHCAGEAHRATLARRAVLAPFAGGLFDFGNLVDLAAKRAASALPAGNDFHR
jgi:hypothetical protein